MRRLFIITMLLCITMAASASKAVGRKMTVTLADGRTVTATMRGDENFHAMVASTGEIIVRDGDKWRTVTEAEQAEQQAAMAKGVALRKANEAISASYPFPRTGSPKALVIMVNFADVAFTYTKADIEKLLNSTDYDTTSGNHGYGSARQWFSDCSNGTYTPQFDVVGPYTLSNPTSYYGGNGSGNAGADKNVVTLMKDACAAADADVDFSQYDSNNDGYVDLVYVFYAGYGENWDDGTHPEYIWPKSGVSSFGTYDGKKTTRYDVSNELMGYPGVEQDLGVDAVPLCGIGVFVHEMSHTIGLPDLYPTVTWTDVTNYDNQSLEQWSVLDAGENVNNGFYPTPYTAWERSFLGWGNTLTELSVDGQYELKALIDGGTAYKILNPNDATKNEYYILENVPNTAASGWYKKLSGTGMIITHVNYNSSYFSNFSNPNNV